jgi:hypothetical protein
MLGPDCDGRYDNGRLCMITDHPLNETLDGGPFPAGDSTALSTGPGLRYFFCLSYISFR